MNRQATISNGTVFGVWPLSRSVPVIGGVLIVLFVLMEPEASRGLGLVERTVYWVLHVGLGLSAFYFASWLLLPRAMGRLPTWLALVLTGLAGTMIIVPASLLLEHLLPASLLGVEEEEWLSAFAAQGLWQEVLVEFIEVAPEVMVIWIVINLPFLRSRPELNDPPKQDPDDPGGGQIDDNEAESYAKDVKEEFLDRLPRSIGTDVIAISSDLHYLHVYTPLGRCMVLGSLQRAAEAMGDDGLRVHRTHWVARRAVVNILKDGQQWYCALSNGLKIPVSRRNKALVAGWFGKNARVYPIRKSRRTSS